MIFRKKIFSRSHHPSSYSVWLGKSQLLKNSFTADLARGYYAETITNTIDAARLYPTSSNDVTSLTVPWPRLNRWILFHGQYFTGFEIHSTYPVFHIFIFEPALGHLHQSDCCGGLMSLLARFWSACKASCNNAPISFAFYLLFCPQIIQEMLNGVSRNQILLYMFQFWLEVDNNEQFTFRPTLRAFLH